MKDMQHVLVSQNSEKLYSDDLAVDGLTNFLLPWVDTQQIFSTDQTEIHVNGAVLELAAYLPACAFDRYLLFWINRSPDLVTVRPKIILSTHVGATDRFYETRINLISRYSRIFSTNNFAGIETATVYLEATIKGI